MDQSDSKLVLHDVPIFLWIFGLIFTVIGALILYENGRAPVMGLILGVIGLAFLLFTSVLTITADRITRTLKLEYRSALRHNLKQMSFEEIAGIKVERSISHGKGGSGYTYKVVAKLKDNRLVPFRSFSSSGSGGKERQASRLRSFIGVPEFDNLPPALAALKSQTAGIHETDGIRWQIDPLGGAGARWRSQDFRTRDLFLFLGQKADGQASRGFMASLGSMFLKYALSAHGFNQDDTPGIEQAVLLAPLDPALESHFMAFTNVPESAKNMLNSKAVAALAEWARRYPVKQFRKASSNTQLVALFGPNGLSVATLDLSQPERTNELKTLGLELLKSQTGARAQVHQE